jgi:protein O-GlcNAc transferase
MEPVTITEAIEHLRTAFDQERALRVSLLAVAADLNRSGRVSEAEAAYKDLVTRAPQDAAAWAGLGRLYARTGRYTEALQSLETSLALNPRAALAHFGFGELMSEPGVSSAAARAYIRLAGGGGPFRRLLAAAREAVADQPIPDAHVTLGNVLMATGDTYAAIDSYLAALRLSPSSHIVLRNLSAAWELKNDHAQSSMWLGLALYHEGEYEAAIVALEHVGSGPSSTEVQLALGDCYKAVDRHDDAFRAYDEGLRHAPDSAAVYLRAATALHTLGRTGEAARLARRGTERCPRNLELKYFRNLMLPVVYTHERRIDQWRRRYSRGLTRLIDETPLGAPHEQRKARDLIAARTNFYLPYQGRNDRDLQVQYGSWVARVMAASHPDSAARPPMPPLTAGGRIRIGYVSAYFRQHAVAKCHLGWLRHHDSARFEIHCYHIGRDTDFVTDEFRRCSDAFHHCPDDFDGVRRRIAADRLHILVYLDLGMFAPAMLLAALWLAPVQCLGAAHPETSGLPTIDYFLSSAFMEPSNGQDFYSEKLVLLPRTGMSYSMPVSDGTARRRADLAIRDDAVVYLCCQSPYKYLPQHDRVLVDIARRVPDAQFVFIASHPAAAVLERRLARAFESGGVDGRDRCRFLPRQLESEFSRLMRLADVYLDSIDWNGNNTSHEAVAAGLPIVTWPRGAMRGHHSAALLTALGVTDTIARSGEEYVAMAVRLGVDRDWRQDVSRRMLERRAHLFDDVECVRALEAFYRRVVGEQAGLPDQNWGACAAVD